MPNIWLSGNPMYIHTHTPVNATLMITMVILLMVYWILIAT